MIIQKAVDIICNQLDVHRIYIVGFRDHQRRYNIFHGQDIGTIPRYIRHLDMLIVATRPGATSTNPNPPKAALKVQADLNKLVSNTIFIISPGDFRKRLRNEVFFALRAVNAGYLAFECANYKLEESIDSPTKDWKGKAEKQAHHLYSLGDEFIKCALSYSSEQSEFKNFSLLFFKQAVECYLRSAINYILGFQLDGDIDTQYLFSIAQWTRPAIAEVLIKGKQRNEKMMDFFRDARQSAFRPDSFVEIADLYFIRDKVVCLRNAIIPFMKLNAKSLDDCTK